MGQKYIFLNFFCHPLVSLLFSSRSSFIFTVLAVVLKREVREGMEGGREERRPKGKGGGEEGRTEWVVEGGGEESYTGPRR